MTRDIKYKKTFLSGVICRIDFANDLSERIIDKIMISKDLALSFPIKDKDQIKEDTNISVVDRVNEEPLIEKNKDQYIERIIVDNLGKNKFCISKKYFFFEYKNYISFDETKKHLLYVIKEILDSDESTIIKRFGLRYINVFDVDCQNVYKSYFSDSIKCLVRYDDFSELKVSRAMGEIELIKDDIRLRMKYGNFNRNYPGVIEKYDFVLDYDAYMSGLFMLSDIYPKKVDTAHNMIQSAFEESITDSLRTIMRG